MDFNEGLSHLSKAFATLQIYSSIIFDGRHALQQLDNNLENKFHCEKLVLLVFVCERKTSASCEKSEFKFMKELNYMKVI